MNSRILQDMVTTRKSKPSDPRNRARLLQGYRELLRTTGRVRLSRRATWPKNKLFPVRLTGRSRIVEGVKELEVKYVGFSDIWTQFRPETELKAGEFCALLCEEPCVELCSFFSQKIS